MIEPIEDAAYSGLSVLAATSALLLAGCAASTGSDTSPAAERTSAQPTTTTIAASSSPSTQVLTVEQLAAAVGCQPTFAGKAADYRQASCTVAGAEVVMLDFATAEGQRSWLDYATMYGGSTWSANRWALSGKSKEYMETLRAKLDGSIDERSGYGSGPGSGGS